MSDEEILRDASKTLAIREEIEKELVGQSSLRYLYSYILKEKMNDGGGLDNND